MQLQIRTVLARYLLVRLESVGTCPKRDLHRWVRRDVSAFYPGLSLKHFGNSVLYRMDCCGIVSIAPDLNVALTDRGLAVLRYLAFGYDLVFYDDRVELIGFPRTNGNDYSVLCRWWLYRPRKGLYVRAELTEGALERALSHAMSAGQLEAGDLVPTNVRAPSADVAPSGPPKKTPVLAPLPPRSAIAPVRVQRAAWRRPSRLNPDTYDRVRRIVGLRLIGDLNTL